MPNTVSDPIVIVGMARTPMGGLLGELAPLSAGELGAAAVKAALADAKVAPGDVDQVYMGNVLSAGQGQAPARQAALKAGLPESAEATTLNKMCGSGMQAAILARATLMAGDADVIVAGGAHSMIHPFGMTGFYRLSTLSTRNDEPQRASRPFDRDREGFVVGEGAAMVILE
ncbi:MAG: hypothetical protein MI723_01945, partial [Caulobacterales bacterium]|nr:hypothetical protein [Caulobacterales bacterium]